MNALPTVEIRAHIALGVLYKQFALGFAYPASNGSPPLAIDVVAEVAELLQNERLTAATTQLKATLAKGFDTDLTLEEEYTYLFGRKVQVPLYANRYLPAGSYGQPRALADINGFYHAFGFQVMDDLPDHIGTQLEFLGVLCFKEAYACEQEWKEQAEICRKARRHFLMQHLLVWFPAMAERLRHRARLPFYPALADAISALLKVDCDELDVIPEEIQQAWIEPDGTQLEDAHACPI